MKRPSDSKENILKVNKKESLKLEKKYSRIKDIEIK